MPSRKEQTLAAFRDELEKISAVSGTVIGSGIGAGLMGLRGALREWDRRLIQAPARSAQERRQRFRESAFRTAGGALLGGLGGGVVGHFGSKGIQAIKSHATDVSRQTADVLEAGFGRAIKKELVGGLERSSATIGRNVGKAMEESSARIGHNLATGAAAGFDPALAAIADKAGKNFAKAVAGGAGEVGSNLGMGLATGAEAISKNFEAAADRVTAQTQARIRAAAQQVAEEIGQKAKALDLSHAGSTFREGMGLNLSSLNPFRKR